MKVNLGMRIVIGVEKSVFQVAVERSGPLRAAPDLPQHVRGVVRLHAAGALGRALRSGAVQGSCLQSAQKVPTNGDGQPISGRQSCAPPAAQRRLLPRGRHIKHTHTHTHTQHTHTTHQTRRWICWTKPICSHSVLPLPSFFLIRESTKEDLQEQSDRERETKNVYFSVAWSDFLKKKEKEKEKKSDERQAKLWNYSKGKVNVPISADCGDPLSAMVAMICPTNNPFY